MNAFDILAEAKMRRWEQDKEEGTADTAQRRQLTLAGTGGSLEKQLFADIKRLLLRAKLEPPDVSTDTLRQAEKMQIQLSARLERSGCYRLSRYLSEEIRKLRLDGPEENVSRR
jgi:hypothetical protein